MQKIQESSHMSYFSQLARMETSQCQNFLQMLSLKELKLLNEEFIFSAHPHQRPPATDYTTWLILGGRGWDYLEGMI